MKKLLLISFCFMLVFTNSVCANNTEIKTIKDVKNDMHGLNNWFNEGVQKGFAGDIYVYKPSDSIWYCIDKLIEIGVLPSKDILDSHRWEEETITRREILEFLIPLKEKHMYDIINAKTSEEAIEKLEYFSTDPVNGLWLCYGTEEKFDFKDIHYSSDDFLFTYKAYAGALLRGKIINGEKYALLDEEADCGEAIAMICRLFLNMPSFKEDDMIAVMQELGYTDNFMYYFAEKINLINSDNLLDVSSPEISLEKLNENISKGEFFWLLYRALYVPVFGTLDFGMPYYYINDFIGEPFGTTDCVKTP